jgi:hypothetical protein
MARNWQYPRWRRLLMQSAMWVILGGTVGLAALLDRHQHELSQVPLAPPLQCGSIHLQLPANWIIESSDTGMMTASESNIDVFTRVVEVTVAPPSETGLVDQLLRRQIPAVAPLKIGFGISPTKGGNLYAWQGEIEFDGQAFPCAHIVVTTILPSGPEVTLRLEHPDRNRQSVDLDDDIELVKRIAATVQTAPTAVGTGQE